MLRERPKALVVTWASGGNLPPLLAVAELLAGREFDVDVLASSATRADAERRGLATHAYRRAPEPDPSVPFEAQAGRFLAQAAGVELARDVHELAQGLAPDLMLVDCMLPAALAAGEAAGIRTASLVHFPYALARSVMVSGGGAWTTDRTTLDATRQRLGLRPTASDLDAWESPQLLLVTLPRWFDLPGELPEHVVHAGPLGVAVRPPREPAQSAARALLAFSTTVMEGQRRLVANVCAAIEQAGVAGLLTLGPALDAAVADAAVGVEVAEWADHDELMRSCELVVTHGGLGTTLRALAHGRPLLLLPLGRDQHFNAARVEELGAGLVLDPESSPDTIADAILRLRAGPSFHEGARQAAVAIAAERADESAADALSRLVI
jgi:UDP:flavonoid glycosyltransferase YjiC (YdhE family)